MTSSRLPELLTTKLRSCGRCATRWASKATGPRGFTSPRAALAALRPGEFDLLLTDLQMPEIDGIALIDAARKVDPDLGAIVMTGHGTIDTAVLAMRNGALDYITKPIPPERGGCR